MDNEIQQLVNSDDPYIKQLASEIQDVINNSELTDDQIKELATDILEVKNVDKITNNLERKIQILQAIKMLKTIVGLMPK